jgi:hypothetical protein
MRGFEVQNLLRTLHAIGPLFDDGSHCKNGQVHPYQGCVCSRCKTSQELYVSWGLPLEPCGEGAGPRHLLTVRSSPFIFLTRHRGCMASRRKTSQELSLETEVHSMTGRTAKMHSCPPIKDAWVRGSKPPGNFASDRAFV